MDSVDTVQRKPRRVPPARKACGTDAMTDPVKGANKKLTVLQIDRIALAARDGEASESDLRCLLAYFRDGVRNLEPIPQNLLEYIAESFDRFLVGIAITYDIGAEDFEIPASQPVTGPDGSVVTIGKRLIEKKRKVGTLEAAFGIVRRTGPKGVDPQRQIQIAATVLKGRLRGMSASEAECDAVKLHGVNNKTVQNALAQWFTLGRAMVGIQQSNASRSLTDDENSRLVQIERSYRDASAARRARAQKTKVK